MAQTPELAISCHCGAAEQTVRLRTQSPSGPREINLCHCAACRHNTGLLCVSYVGIERPGSVHGLVEYRSTTRTSTRLFCANCGCHVFWRHERADKDESLGSREHNELSGGETWELWAVATGVIIGRAGEDDGQISKDGSETLMTYTRHINTAGTKDGGLSSFIRYVEGSRELEIFEHWGTPPASPHFAPTDIKPGHPRQDVSFGELPHDEEKESGGEVLNAFCHCKAVRFHIMRPDPASRLPQSNFPDLMIPYHTGSPDIKNPGDVKWWLRPGQDPCSEGSQASSAEQSEVIRYLAGTCACRSCRLVSGFEIQTWAFVPRANIFFHIPRNTPVSKHKSSFVASVSQSPDESCAETSTIPLDFATLPPGILTSYESTPGVRREFCARCGATVFWRDKWRPELMDVSLGLLDANEGARAETWLDWWTERVSFAEDAGNGRTGDTARRARCLVDSLEKGLRNSKEKSGESARGLYG
ncbi:hypothetical protein F5Y19DRAFT_444051 [Xylariaceae sp. FL1651]|nr:hypothetical protein F5Y19DRAFT_444051 [Xylariaceae sp. FL1651]